MGRSVTPKYRVETVCAGPCANTPMAWRTEYGRPTEANLAEWVRRHNESYKPGGCNEHIGKAYGDGADIVKATIVRQSDGKVVATFIDAAGWRKYLETCYGGAIDPVGA